MNEESSAIERPGGNVGARIISDPALPESLSDENAKKEAAEVASGRYDENESARTDQLRHHVHLVMLVGIWSILILIGIFAVAWHYLAPKQWKWLSQKQLTAIKTFIFSGAVTGAGSGYFRTGLYGK